MLLQQLLQQAAQQLAAAAPDPLFEAEILLAHVLQQPRSHLRAWPEKNIDAQVVQQLQQLVQRRSQREPIAYLTGVKEFWSLELLVNSHTLIPRPETELLVETALTLFPANKTINVVDLGTGCGAIALALAHERPHWHIVAVDSSSAALQLAAKNAQRLQLNNNVSFCQGNWCSALPAAKFHLIISNPPYIAESEWESYAQNLAYEPRQALISGQDGLEAIREISQSATNCLKNNGFLLLEHGYQQAKIVRHLLLELRYNNVRSICDLAGHERVTMGNYLR
jgi:release factor glutamine methyltransferase